MADFGDEAGKDVLDNITRMARMPFDEMVRIMLRKMLNGSKLFKLILERCLEVGGRSVEVGRSRR